MRIDNKETGGEKVEIIQGAQPDGGARRLGRLASRNVIVDLILHLPYLYRRLITRRSYETWTRTARRGDPENVGIALRPTLVL